MKKENLCYDTRDSYAPAFYVFAALMLINLVMTQIVIGRERKNA